MDIDVAAELGTSWWQGHDKAFTGIILPFFTSAYFLTWLTINFGKFFQGCVETCICENKEDESQSITKQEGLALAVGALAPLAVGGTGLAIFKIVKGSGSSAPRSDLLSSPRPSFQGKRDSIPSMRDSPPPSYHGMRRGSTPVSIFGEDDDMSFDPDFGDTPLSPRSDPVKPEPAPSTATNAYRPRKNDTLNSWMWSQEVTLGRV